MTWRIHFDFFDLFSLLFFFFNGFDDAFDVIFAGCLLAKSTRILERWQLKVSLIYGVLSLVRVTIMVVLFLHLLCLACMRAALFVVGCELFACE